MTARRDFWVYKAFDAEGGLLYVGFTGVPARRLSGHSRDSAWAALADSIRIEHFDSAADALAREQALIREHQPPWNVAHATPRLEPGELTVELAADIARCGTSSIRTAIRADDLVARKTSRGYRIQEADLHRWITGERR